MTIHFGFFSPKHPWRELGARPKSWPQTCHGPRICNAMSEFLWPLPGISRQLSTYQFYPILKPASFLWNLVGFQLIFWPCGQFASAPNSQKFLTSWFELLVINHHPLIVASGGASLGGPLVRWLVRGLVIAGDLTPRGITSHMMHSWIAVAAPSAWQVTRTLQGAEGIEFR